MDVQAYLETKERKNYFIQLKKELLQSYQKTITLGRKRLSKASAEIGLYLFEIHPDLPEKKSHWGYKEWHGTDPSSKVFQGIIRICPPEEIWNRHEDLFRFLFGEELLPIVREAWHMFPQHMYQTGHARRSFRAPNLTSIHFSNQLSFVSELSGQLKYDMPLSEYAIYSNQFFLPELGKLLAAAVNLGDQDIKQLLLDTAYMRHATARVSRDIVKGLLLSDEPEAWEAVEKLLLAAQRQEGLRQTILESLDESSIGAMKHIIKVIIDHKLARFSSVVRAVDVWAGLNWGDQREPAVRRFLELAHTYLTEPDKIPAAMRSRDNMEIYAALWAKGVEDIEQCPPLIDEALKQQTLEKTVLCLYLIMNIGLVSKRREYGMRFISHDHLMIFSMAVNLLSAKACISQLDQQQKDDLFDLLADRLADIPKEGKTFEGKGFSWTSISSTKEDVFDLMILLTQFNQEAEVRRLIAWFQEMPLGPREKITSRLLKGFYRNYYSNSAPAPESLTPLQRDFALTVLKDRAPDIKAAAIQALEKAQLEATELQQFVDMLKGKSANMRKSVLGLLTKQAVPMRKKVMEQLLTAKNQEQRLAGLDLLTQEKKLSALEGNWIDQQAQQFSSREKISQKEEILLKPLLQTNDATLTYSAENGFGLFDPTQMSEFQEPQAPKKGLYRQRSKKHPFGFSQSLNNINKALQDLKALYLQHKNHEYEIENWDGSHSTILLGSNFRSIKLNRNNEKEISLKEQYNNHPLPRVWSKWVTDHQLDSCDLMLLNMANRDTESTERRLSKGEKKVKSFLPSPDFPKLGKHNYHYPLFHILRILPLKFPFIPKAEFFNDWFHTIFSSLSAKENGEFLKLNRETSGYYYGRNYSPIYYQLDQLYRTYSQLSSQMDNTQFTRFWELEKWRMEAPVEDVRATNYSSLYNYCRAFQLILINEDELMHRIMMPDAIQELTKVPNKHQKNQVNLLQSFTFLPDMLGRSRSRILEIELQRGDTSTPVTLLAQNLQQLFGISYFVDILRAMGKDKLLKGYMYTYNSRAFNKKEMLSSLLKRCFPQAEEKQEQFNDAIKVANFTESRLLEAATYAPQWLPFVANYLGWDGLASGAWWLHAHTNAHHSAETESEIGKFSKVSMPDFKDGAVDTQWFREVYKTLGKTRWGLLYKAARYISESGGYKRAQLYADVMLGITKITEIKKRIKEKRNQDALKALGLVPLSKKTPGKDLLNRYSLLVQFKKESKQFGSQRQASEGRSVQIAMENLARTAGYSDPMRLSWAMEKENALQILSKADTLTLGDVEVTLHIDEQGQASLTHLKKGKKIAAPPAKYKKDKDLQVLKSYVKTLKDQYKRTRASLEQAMIDGENFPVQEFEQLMEHPVVSPMLNKLLILSGDSLGLWKDGQLMNHTGELMPVGEAVSLAHCTDLYSSGQWSAWQAFCFDQQLVQPFKQVFRELYVPTQDELKEKSVSRRYAGHQVQPKKTVALLKSRGWTVDYETGLQKVYHKENFIAKMYAMADWFSPADVESPALETVEFHSRKDHKNVDFEEVPNRIFSEVMRDIDLVVSVAHVGEVDPEASQSSIELRTAIARETVRLFKLKNVEFKGNHALIKGTKASYSVHMGSAVAHQVTGSHLSILPIHSQKRGRMFLPFLDEDPKSAEVISKILLLAKDEKIQDPTILRQIR